MNTLSFVALVSVIYSASAVSKSFCYLGIQSILGLREFLVRNKLFSYIGVSLKCGSILGLFRATGAL